MNEAPPEPLLKDFIQKQEKKTPLKIMFLLNSDRSWRYGPQYKHPKLTYKNLVVFYGADLAKLIVVMRTIYVEKSSSLELILWVRNLFKRILS